MVRGEERTVGKTLVIHNPAAGSLKNSEGLDFILKTLKEQKVQTGLLRTPFSREALASHLEEGVERLLVAGGDGTLNRVVNHLMGVAKPPPVAAVPLGTANDFAHGLGIESVADGVKKALAGKIIPVDVGCLAGRHFINVAAGGFLCEVAHGTDRRLKKTLGRLAYYLKGLMELSSVKPVELKAEVDGRESFAGEAFLFLILNSPRAGNFSNLAPRAAPGDGSMDLLVLKKCSAPDLMAVVVKALSGQHLRDPHIFYQKGRSFRIGAPAPLVTDLDGEAGPSLPWQVDILPRRLEFLC